PSRSARAQPVASDFARLILPATAASSFGNGGQAIEIARGHFEPFSKCALKSLNNQTDFDSAILWSAQAKHCLRKQGLGSAQVVHSEDWPYWKTTLSGETWIRGQSKDWRVSLSLRRHRNRPTRRHQQRSIT